ncbi:TIGR01906 family membrane protein [Galactobacter sp.]|uniref:TIGR01906 family membrane protein n=1 Tax=Galactobacter sp. TaxID=2676125 RepID=UPI0025C6CC31|nr:TIGR01906 family membrane protein [Galactobacter sp.]
MSQNDEPTPQHPSEEPTEGSVGPVVDPAEAPAVDATATADDAVADQPAKQSADRSANQTSDTTSDQAVEEAAAEPEAKPASKVEPASATAALSQPEPELFESDDFAGATAPPSLQERAAQMRRARLARYEAASSVEDSGPETQAMDAVTGTSGQEPSKAPTPGASSPTAAQEKGEQDQTLANPIREPEEPPFAATAVLTPPAEAAQQNEGKPETDAGVPGVTEDAEFVTEPQTKRVFSKILQYVIAILTPFVVLIGAVRAVASGAFLWIEYHRPGFPVDPYGFDAAERTTLGSYGLNYINGFAGRSYLGDLQTPEGNRTLAEPQLFKDTEVGHMADVQSLIHIAYLVACLALLVIVISVLVLRVRYAGGVRRGLFAGAWATVGVLLVLGVLGAVGWDAFFTDFHRLFFSGGNWEFYMDDTLIRLYPPQFWVDAAVVLAAIGVIVSAVVLWATWPTRRRREASRNKQAARVYRMG